MYEAKHLGFSQRSFYETYDPWIFEKLPWNQNSSSSSRLDDADAREWRGSGRGKVRKNAPLVCDFFFGSLANPQMTSRSSHCRAAEARFFATSESLRPAISARAVSRPRPRRGDRLFPGREARVERPSGPGGSGARDGRGRARVARPRPVRRLEGQGARGAQSAFRARVRGSPRAFRATAPTPPRARRPRRGLRRGVQGASPALSRPRRASERRAPRSPSLGVSVLIMLCCT